MRTALAIEVTRPRSTVPAVVVTADGPFPMIAFSVSWLPEPLGGEI
jgi:hypothetical protein